MAEPQDFDSAIVDAKTDPNNREHWVVLESLAGELDRPDEVAEVFSEVLSQDLKADTAQLVGERAAQFHDEWFGDEPARVAGVLHRVLELAPEADWAFQRLTVALTVAQRWSDLLSAYDRIIDATEVSRQAQLLDEAAQVAKDVANNPDKAIAYLQRLLPLRPGDAKLAQALERLLEKHARWRDLIDLWTSRLPELSAEDREQSRARIAECWLENLGEPAQALRAAEALLDEAQDDSKACGLLERVLGNETTPNEIRQGALTLLRNHYQLADRPREIVRVLEMAIALAEGRDAEALHAEAGERLAELSDHDGAMRHFSALLASNPASKVTQEKMRQTAQRAQRFDAYATGVANAARACTDVSRRVGLLAEAARTRLDLLDDQDGAIDLFQSALAQEGIEDRDIRMVARRLSELLARADRPRERLDVLERLALVETTRSNRRAVIGEAARLAEALGEPDHALRAWALRRSEDQNDSDALDATIAILESEQRWGPLIEALEQRVANAASVIRKRGDLIRIATIQREQLSAPDAAIEAWKRTQNECGETAETVDALADLLESAGRWGELSELLLGASARETERVTSRLVRLANAQRGHLEDRGAALAGYRNALAINPSHAGARAGLNELLQDEVHRAEAAEVLSAAFRRTQDWEQWLSLVDARMDVAGDSTVRLQLLREAADVLEHKQGNGAGALQYLVRALPLAPTDRALDHRVAQLAGQAGQWAEVAQAYRLAAQNVSGDPHEAARLRLREASIADVELGSDEDAYAAYRAVGEVQPDNLGAAQAIVRIGSRLGRWTEACETAVTTTSARRSIATSLFDAIESAAREAQAFDEVAAALSKAVTASQLPAQLAFTLHHRVASWHREHRSDPAAAELSLKAALALDGTRADVLNELADLQRAHPDQALFTTLRQLTDTDPLDLDVAREAARMAVEHADDLGAAQSMLSTLLARATATWRGTLAGRTTDSPHSHAAWAIDGLVDCYQKSGQAASAVDLLVEGARLPFDRDVRQSLRYRAAKIAAEDLQDNTVAIDMYRSILNENKEDREAMTALGVALEAESRFAELLTLKQLQLELGASPKERLQLRLEVAHLVGEVQRRGGRLEALLQNLADSPGHEESIKAVGELLTEERRYSKLAEVLQEQAGQLEKAGEPHVAAGLWCQVAVLSESHLSDVDRAIECYRRAIALEQSPQLLDALARLYVDQGLPSQAVTWLERLLAQAEPASAEQIVSRLANAHVSADQTEQAVACLEQYLSEDRAALELRSMLADQYRQLGRWEPLARLLTASLPLVNDSTTVEQYAREAAELYINRLNTPDRAIPALERALETAPEDKALRLQIATGLRVAGRTEEAAEVLNGLVEEFGRRRSSARAAVHVELARVAQAQGETEQALGQAELAAKMDAANPSIQKMVAELALATGKQDEAERRYRALLLVVRRQSSGDDVNAVGVSEVLYELHRITAARGEDDQAKELLESALEASVQSDAEVRRFRRALVAHDEPELLLQALNARLEASTEPNSRAHLLSDIADVLDRSLDRAEEALDAQLGAIELLPNRVELHERARELATKANAVPRYVECVSQTVETLRRDEDGSLVANLLMKAGRSLEDDAGDLRGALDIYKRVEESGDRVAEACFALSKVAEKLGDKEEMSRALDRLLELATANDSGQSEDSPRTPQQVNALYRLAEVFISNPERRAQGLGLLERAFQSEPRYDQAGKVLRAAAADDAHNSDLMSLYERVARGSGDWEMLLDFLERRAHLEGATPHQVKEAVDLALEHDQPQRAEALLGRAVEAGRMSSEGLTSVSWAVSRLAQARAAAGDFAAARALFIDLSDIADQETVLELGLSLADSAASVEEHRTLAAEVYEQLRMRDPSLRRVWEPLVNLYRELGDSGNLQSVIQSTLPSLVDPAERNAMRMQLAEYLLDVESDSVGAIEVLRDVLLDDPDHIEGAGLLEKVLRDSGDHEGLADFLWQRFEEAKSRRNPQTVADVALRLGNLLAESKSDDTQAVYRQALEIVPDNQQLVQALVALLTEETERAERAQLLERQLELCDGENARALALELCDLREALADDEGMRRALQLGHRSAPGDEAIRDRLASWYRSREEWQPLAQMLVSEAREFDEVALSVSRFREAAAIYREKLDDGAGAIGFLREAQQRSPSDLTVTLELCDALTSTGDLTSTIEALGAALEAGLDDTNQVRLLQRRSELYGRTGDDESAVGDLERAYELDPDTVGPALVTGLDRWRANAAQVHDRDSQRAATLRLAQLLTGAGDVDRSSELLSEWVELEPRDREALVALRDMNSKIENWDGVIAACSRLAVLEEGEQQVQAVLMLADASERAGRPEASRRGLEHVHQAQPGEAVIRDRLRVIYEQSGAHREFATLLLADGDQGTDEGTRYGAYRRAAEVFLLELGDPEAALEPAQKALALREGHDATILLVDVLTAAGRTQDVVGVLEPAIAAHKRRSPELAGLQQRMARAAAASGDRENQLAWLKKSFDVDRKNGEIAAELAQLATEMGDYDLALKPLRQITLLENPGPISRVMALLWEAKIEHARGNRAKAELWAKKALREDPNFSEAEQFLTEIRG